ncbi:SpaH/EbpB family LPXTG-anchored major pilin [Sanguibacter massiliensis]|uniref:SpaH/EbpB family LPXTG-anchored major pilin n=1 Tax=Sanguibacter massiliensis TaxID=1973217 RepID=UPI000C85C67E|nr:SpaH/EbpB family LPXTG-anchored major pilin [Sanguibacter massiliensis]
MTRSTIWRRAAAVLAVGALAAVGAAGAAQAAPIIDPATTGSIVVHKRLNPTGTLLPGNGLPDASAPGTPLEGIEFDVQRITTVDLTTTAGWTAANGYAANPSTISAGDLAPATTQTTAGAGGTATFSPLVVGAYLVTEQLTPAQVADGLTPAPPFVVTVPMTHPTDLDTWIYDVNVYPKNLQSTVTKTVDDGPDTTYQVGDRIGWTVTTQVPAQTTTQFVFKDVLVEQLEVTAPVADTVAVTVGATTLVPTTDYTIDADALADDNTLVVRLTPAGLVKLNDRVGTTDKIALAFTTTVLSLPTNGVIENTATVFPNDSFPETGPGITTPPVVSRFGEINILKRDSATNTPLAAAEFKVFASEADASAYAADPVANADRALTAQQNGTGALVSTFVTGADGTVSITGLRASNWQDGVRLTDSTTFQNYWLLETKAPTGYELATAPIGAITVLYDQNAPTVLPHGDITVPNVGKPELPLTGGQIATGVFGLLGALVLTGGVLLVIRARRQGARG